LSSFDVLFRHKEVWDGIGGGSEAMSVGKLFDVNSAIPEQDR
jgi:hypothetical protein